MAKGSLFWFSYLRHSAKKGKHRMGEKGAESSFPLCTNASPSLLLLLNHMNIKKEARPKGNPSPAIVMSSYNKEQLLAWVWLTIKMGLIENFHKSCLSKQARYGKRLTKRVSMGGWGSQLWTHVHARLKPEAKVSLLGSLLGSLAQLQTSIAFPFNRYFKRVLR